MADLSPILSPKRKQRTLGKFFNKLLSKSFMTERRQEQSYIDVSITKQKKFLETKIPKIFPSYRVYTRKKPKSPAKTKFYVPELKLTSRNTNIFKFKEDLGNYPNKGYTSARNNRKKINNQSIREPTGLISLLRTTERDRKTKDDMNIRVKLTKIISYI